ncbi:MAG: NAD(P)/FAD-dependent oxidoreductase [Gammaproteobacteria bacterium]|nr:NAD(P)/FAD-dependent oxidoreductase [Gammaproteobacteria bacterium]
MDTALYDMAVIGAGPAGSVCAYSALATSEQVSVALIDRDNFPRDKACGDAVRNDAVSVLSELNLGAIFNDRTEVRDLRATYPPKYRYLQKLFEWNENTYYIIERKVFDHYLYEAAINRGARDFTGYRLINAKFDELGKFWNLILRQKSGAITEMRCRTLVGADGAGSRVRRTAGLERNEDDHTSLALRAYAKADGLTEGIMRIDYLENLIPGYGWTFPLLDGKVNIGVVINKRDFKRNESRLETYLDEYVRYLQSEGVTIKNLDDVKTHPLPLGSQSPPLVPKHRVALIGDAAAMIDPFSGEGIHYGIWAGHTLGSAIGNCMNGGGNIQSAMEYYAKAYTEQFGKDMEASESVRVWVRFHKLFM